MKNKTDKIKKIWNKTHGLCAHCGHKVSSRNRTIDHYIPKSDNGGYDLRNLMPLCYKCNRNRGCKSINPQEFYKFAPQKYIAQCLEYEHEFIHNRTTLNGDIWN